MKIKTLKEALERIAELEKTITDLKAENDMLKSRNTGGRKPHDESWLSSYNDFVIKYEGGMSVMEVVAEGNISRRTAYRYLKYYKESLGE